MNMEHWWKNSDRTPNTWIKKKTCPSATLSATKPQELAWDRTHTSVFRGLSNHFGDTAQP